jgi:hypothetical protein
MEEPRQHMVTVWPDRFGDDDRWCGRNPAEDIHPVSLALNESTALHGVKWMGASLTDAQP